MSFSLLSPLFLAGLLAVAVPVIIHLMRRKKARAIDFSTLRFLREVHAKLSMRQKIREMLLMAARIALILLTVLAMARPVLRGAISSGTADAPVTMVFVVDNSLSMSTQIGGVSNLERARSILATHASDMKNDDRMAVITAVAMPTEDGAVVNAALPPGPILDSVVTELRQGYDSGDMVSAMKRADEMIAAAETPNRELYILGDMQFSTHEPLTSSKALPDFSRHQDLMVYYVDFYGEEVRSAAPRKGYFKSGPPGSSEVTVVGEIVNYSRLSFDVRLSISIDGKKVGEKSYSLKPEERVPFDCEIRGAKEGFHECTVSLQGDDVPGDNDLCLSFFTAPLMKVLIVNGRPSTVSALDASWYFRCALDPRWKQGETGRAGIATSATTAEEFTPSMLDNCDVVALLDPLSIPATLRDSISSFVMAGGGLVLAPGPSSDVARIVPDLSAPGRQPLLAAKILKQVTAPNEDGYFINFASLSLDNPVWSGIVEKSLQYLCNEPNESVFQLEADTGSAEWEVLAAFNNSWPAIVSSRYGSGRIVQFAFPLDTSWSSLPLKPVFPILCHRAVNYAGGSLSALRSSIQVGKPMSMNLRRSTPEMLFKVDYPGWTVELTPRLTDEGFVLDAPPSTEPGFVRFHPVSGASFKGQLVAVKTPDEESRQEYSMVEDLEAALGKVEIKVVDDPGRLAEIRSRLKAGYPLWGFVLLVVLILLAVESWLANDVLKRISAGRNAVAVDYGPLSKKAIVSLRMRRKKEAG